MDPKTTFAACACINLPLAFAELAHGSLWGVWFLLLAIVCGVVSALSGREETRG